ncbi:DUF1638 domain-containing protein [bacterium]|nr:DUF1638 domain-containing protein [bacterium]
MVEKYGEDNAKYLMEVMGEWQRRYKRAAFISMNLLDEDEYKEYVASLAIQNGWDHEVLMGNMDLLERFINFDLNSNDFLIVPPNRKIVPSYDEEVIKTED